ncbi:hypothetical protein GCM10008955_32720 [Deinococcus malanensis]|uniref:Uncharacterized protein n=1 Tax=Deinococcus malanensis TaxID=1706855 RepID=A0ABQ2EZN2_9DEIO|nr:hypothetical protein GCM10008955_32720 [Deinococcus malanensis]
MPDTPDLKNWHLRYPPEGSWIFIPGKGSGRFTWRGLTPVLSDYLGDRPLLNSPATSRHERFHRSNWRYPVTTSRPWLFVGRAAAAQTRRSSGVSRTGRPKRWLRGSTAAS